MNSIRWILCMSLGLSWISAAWADYHFLKYDFANDDQDGVETLSKSIPAIDLLIWGIPTAVGVIGTYKVIMGDRSSVTFAQALKAIGYAGEHAKTVSGSLRALITTALRQLKPHEIIALLTTCGMTIVNVGNAVTNLTESIIHGIRAYRAEGFTRKKHLHNMMTTLKLIRNNVVLSTISAASLWLLIDYARDGRMHNIAGNA